MGPITSDEWISLICSDLGSDWCFRWRILNGFRYNLGFTEGHCRGKKTRLVCFNLLMLYYLCCDGRDLISTFCLPRREFEEEMLVEYAKWEAKGNGFQSLVISSSSDYYFLA